MIIEWAKGAGPECGVRACNQLTSLNFTHYNPYYRALRDGLV